ncbi:MAG: M23 family metallopeptidase [Bacillota bacterium]|nr:M23 family metallopeptidase [Bacillota bacterium]
MWRRLIRSRGFILLIFAVIFSFGILGQVDTRMHIGGSDWDMDSLIYINIDGYVLEDFIYQDDPTHQSDSKTYPLAQAPAQTGKSLQNTDNSVSSASDFGPLEILDLDLEKLELVSSESSFDPDESAAVSYELEYEPERLAEVDHTGEQSLADAAEAGLAPQAVQRVEAAVPSVELPKVEEKREEKKEEKPAIFVHKVNPGETLWDIALAYGVSVDTISSANDLKNKNFLTIGQELQIPSVNGVLHQVASGESLWEISERYNVPLDEITRANAITDPNRIQPNTKLVIPGATQLRPRDVLLVNGQLQKAFDWPVKGRISSTFGPRWGRMHNGLDIAVPTGTQVKAAADGRVTFAGWNGGYGILVIIDHGNNIETRYAHNSRLNVKVGQRVSRGETVAYSGNTGVSTGPHVHFEIRYRNNPVNPQTYLK